MFFFLPLMSRGETDNDLVRRFKSGDRDAFGEIVLRYQHRVFTLACAGSATGPWRRRSPRTVFLNLFRGLAEFRGESSLSTFIFRVAVNHCKNKRSTSIGGPTTATNRSTETQGTTPISRRPNKSPTKGPGTDRAVHRSEAERILEQALERSTTVSARYSCSVTWKTSRTKKLPTSSRFPRGP
jgi:DNA-directed RNA polymerase specialized sigma24 family protein